MKKFLLVILPLFLFSYCTSFNIHTEVKKRSFLKKFKSSGILFRIPASNVVQSQRFAESLSYWLRGFKKINSLKIIVDADKVLTTVNSDYDRFYQMTEDNEFQVYKSIGVIAHYLKKNNDDLKEIIETNGLDSLIIVEVDSVLSPEMQFMDFNSTVVMITNENKIAYLDHQFDTFDTFESQREIIGKNMVDMVCTRVIELLEKFNYIKENI